MTSALGVLPAGAATGRPTPEPVDWALASRTARAIAGRDDFSGSYLGRSLQRDFAEVSAEAEDAVARATGLAPLTPARAEVVDRRDWADVNVSSMRRLLDPFTTRIAPRLARNPLSPVTRRVAGAELGVLLGYVAKRVLGQYDLLVPDAAAAPRSDIGAAAGDAVYYVGPNVLALEKRFAFRPRDFRRWIALHELTHRAQFTGVPWMHSYFLGLVEEVFGMMDPDPRRFADALRRAADSLRAGRNPLDDGGLVMLFAGPEHRAALERVQALMSLLEGHGNAVMNVLGAELVDGQERMAAVLDARRTARGATALLHKVLGLELKMRQYEVGEQFVRAVMGGGDLRAIDPAWERPENLPTLAELEDPAAWVERVRASATV